MMVLALVLAGLTISRVVQPWEILILASFLGIANSFDAPARQAFVNELVGREDLTNAIALNATMFQTATIVGPAAAGITYALLGPGWCFLINGLSFVAVIVALRLIKLPAWVKPPQRSSTLSQLKEGLQYVATHQTIRVLIGMIAVTSMFTLSFGTLIPAWAVNVLHGDAKVNGLLYSARGIGSLLGALSIASLGHTIRRGRLFTFGSLVYPVLFLLLAFVRWTPLALILLACAGLGMIMVMNLANAMVQTSTPDHLRGRVMGAYTWIFFGFMPLGALWVGTLAEHFGEPAVVVINATAALFFAGMVWMFAPRLREQ
jgi:MFS family permease